jgi:hypothetical protein
MAQFQNMIITRAGLDMIAQSQAGGTLIFTKGKLGDGQIGDQSIPDLTDLINAKMSVELSSVTAKTEGHVEVRFIVDNTDLDVGFFVREVGIFAKVNDEGVEKLYGYANAGNYTNYLADKTVPIDSIITKIDLVVGNASNVSFTTDKSLVYVTLEDMENALNTHDAGADAHEPAFDAHNAADDAHKDFTGATAEAAGKRGMVPAPAAGDQNKALFGDKSYKSVVQSINGITPDAGGGITLVTGINMLARNQAYQYGDIAYSPNLPSWAYLYCVQAGTTAASEPSFASVKTMGQYITDGTVKWIVDDVRFNIPVGVPFYDTYLHDGCVKLNGANVNRADYIRPAKIATDKSLWTSSPSTEPYKYGNGNGSTTMTLPDFRNRFIEGGDSVGVIDAGLPNITGNLSYCMAWSGTTDGDGAIQRTDSGQNAPNGDGCGNGGTFNFNASRSSSIYGKSQTVQPPAIQLIPQIKF